MNRICTVVRPTASDLEWWQRQALLGWLTNNGVSPIGVVCLELLTVDVPMVAVTRTLLDAEGRAYLDLRDRKIATATTDHLIRVPPPDWWCPEPRDNPEPGQLHVW